MYVWEENGKLEEGIVLIYIVGENETDVKETQKEVHKNLTPPHPHSSFLLSWNSELKRHYHVDRAKEKKTERDIQLRSKQLQSYVGSS